MIELLRNPFFAGTSPVVLPPPLELSVQGGLSVDVYLPDDAVAKAIGDLRHGNVDPPEALDLALSFERLSLDPGFERLLTLELMREHWRTVGLEPYPHQIDTVLRVVRDMRGRAILADEVGLGKTIEAGMVLKEYMLRGLVTRFLILTPASLCRQWQDELAIKFGIFAGIVKRAWHWEAYRHAIASIDAAKRESNMAEILRLEYDVLIVDEAHKLKNAKSQNWRAVSQIRKKYCLMLTATPVQNDLKELFNLVTLMRPGQLGTMRTFRKSFVHDKRTSKNEGALKDLLDHVMVRNQRADTKIAFTSRRVCTIPLRLSPAEQVLYDAVVAFVRSEYSRATTGRDATERAATERVSVLPLITLQREVCSSAFAVALTLEHMLKGETRGPAQREALERLLALAMEVKESAKAEALLELLGSLGEKAIVFTEYRTTQNYLRYRLKQAGFAVLGFDGGMSRSRREIAKHLFRERAQVLVSTESGGEGINLQFCSTVVNFDLPWNPMRVEQRIGRVHRLGQERDVSIFNLSTSGTIEEYILFLLHEKIDMFRNVIGDLDTIVNRTQGKASLEKSIMDILMSSTDDAEVRTKLTGLGERLLSGGEES